MKSRGPSTGPATPARPAVAAVGIALRRLNLAVALTTLAVSTVAVAGLGPAASADQPAGALGTFGPTTTFSYTGSAQTVTVPARATGVRIDATGGSGGTVGGLSFLAGRGAKVRGVVPIDPGTTVLYVNVGGQGGDGGSRAGAGGWNGGGDGGSSSSPGAYGAGGGGASDVRTGTTESTRLLVAAGGGGEGGATGEDIPGTGGDGDRAGFSAGGDANGSGGDPGSGAGAGQGGVRAIGFTGTAASGTQGRASIGGDGGQSSAGAGGGAGGGLFGGGGGGGGQLGGGGGGGASFSAGSFEATRSDDGAQVSLSFDIPPPDFVDCSGLIEGVVGQQISDLVTCRSHGSPRPSLTIDQANLPPGIVAEEEVSGDQAFYVLNGTYSNSPYPGARFYAVPVTATRGDETQYTGIEFLVSPAPTGPAPPSTATPPSTSSESRSGDGLAGSLPAAPGAQLDQPGLPTPPSSSSSPIAVAVPSEANLTG